LEKGMRNPFFIVFISLSTVFVVFLAAAQLAIVNAKVAVTTYHYDNLRTGWNKHEKALTAANFPSNFGIIATVTLDDQVDAQPLIVSSLTIAGGTYDVVYAAPMTSFMSRRNPIRSTQSMLRVAPFFSAETLDLRFLGATRISSRLSPTERSMSLPLSWMHQATRADSSISSAPAAPARLSPRQLRR
jgi:hypothetical protein